MANGRWEDYAGSSRDFDRWLKANAILGSIVAIAILGAALAGLYSEARNGATELSSVNKTVMQAGTFHERPRVGIKPSEAFP